MDSWTRVQGVDGGSEQSARFVATYAIGSHLARRVHVDSISPVLVLNELVGVIPFRHVRRVSLVLMGRLSSRCRRSGGRRGGEDELRGAQWSHSRLLRFRETLCLTQNERKNCECVGRSMQSQAVGGELPARRCKHGKCGDTALSAQEHQICRHLQGAELNFPMKENSFTWVGIEMLRFSWAFKVLHVHLVR